MAVHAGLPYSGTDVLQLLLSVLSCLVEWIPKVMLKSFQTFKSHASLNYHATPKGAIIA